MRKLIIILSAFLLFIHGIAPAQQSQVKYLTLEEVIRLAHENSLQALLAKHRFRNSYWQYRSYKASYLPSVAIQSDLIDMQRAITKNEVFEDGEWVEKYGESQRLNSTMRLEVNQNVPITGGRIFVASELGRLDLLNDEPISFMSTPVSIGFRQPLFGFNSFKWQRQVEPLKYEEAKKQYLSSMEDVNQRAVTYFFDLALEQMNVKKSEFNVANNDTLYQLAKGRFELGMIDQGDLMQMELNLLTSTDDLVKDRLNLEIRKSNLRTFLGFTDNINIELVTSLDVPEFQVDVNQAMQRAQENNPQILSMQRTILEARQNLARTKADSRFNADLMASFGLTQRATDVADVYKEPQQSQRLSVGVTIPVLDWGMRKGQVKMAKSNLDLATVNVQQQMIDFEQQVFLDIMQFNMQSDQLMLAAKTDTISRTRYDITKQKFMIGKVDVLKLNDALAQRDRAIANYMSALRTYWNYYYTVRRTTLWDWEKNQPLLQDFELLIQ
ncbi:MAG: TolC family protein [Bacteroidales bacterium]|jgi:outer membrane protein TolC|nr:TolC family protein [Bacteroidales bacterium]MDD2569527.1 TolC family protein [Bacteroidales bacterium]MDD2812023.1 TolC family protein [Bacteroidales bacterium]MDD3384829.1 TolC family protein [Bacteroidales bacterium]MDD3812038.1 TolC family protein [Bacteroidales bacterium]